MSQHLDEQILQFFQLQLRKEAAAIPWQELGANLGSLGGAGAGIGALLGAARGAHRKYKEVREQGGSGGQALRAGFGGAVGGAIPGAALGALAGGGLGALGTKFAPELTSGLARKSLEAPYLGALSRSGQRQVHGLTGWRPEGGIESIRGGAFGARSARDAAYDAAVKDLIPGAHPEAIQESLEKMHNVRKTKADQVLSAAQEVQDRGMTSLPGVARALKADPKGALRAGMREQWLNSNLPIKALMVGLPAAQLAGAAFGKADPEHGRGERIGRGLAGVASGMALGGVPLVGQLAGQATADAVGGRLGKLFDRKKSPLGSPNEQQISEGQHLPTERVLSDSASGRMPEGIMT